MDLSFLDKLDKLSLLIRKNVTSNYQGERRSNNQGEGLLFKDYTMYTPGNDFRHVDWKVFARTDKLFIKTLTSGVDFLGWVHFPNYRVLRMSTKRKMFRNLEAKTEDERKNAIASYLGMLSWGNGWKLQEEIKNAIF